MSIVRDIYQDILSLERDKLDPGSLKINLNNFSFLKNYQEVACAFFVYPYSQNLNADSFSILPFEEYLEDLKSKRSTYKKQGRLGDNIFGLFLGLCIAITFLLLKPADIFSIQSIVSIFGAYAIGKELWNDLDNFLIDLTANTRLRWSDMEYYYTKQDFGTIQTFNELARRQRYGRELILPNKLDFIHHSNSKTVEMLFDKKIIRGLQGESVRIASINFKKEAQADLVAGLMICFKISLVRKMLFVKVNTEIYQALDRKKLGAITATGWQEGAALSKKTFNLGRLKLSLKPRTITALPIMAYN